MNFKWFEDFAQKKISSLENSKLSFKYFAAAFFFAVVLRIFLESFSAHTSISLNIVSHFFLFYVSVAMSVIILFWLATGEKIKKSAMVVLPSFIVLIVVPIVDLLVTGGKGQQITYLLPGIHENLLLRFFTFTGEFGKWGISSGIKVEGAIVLVAAFVYFFAKSKKAAPVFKIAKGVFWTFVLYVLIFSYSAILFPITWFFDFAGINYDTVGFAPPYVYLILILLQAIVLAWVANKNYFKAIIRERQLLRLIHFEAMFVLGIALGLYGNIMFRLQAEQAFSFAITTIAIALTCFYAMFSNNIADREIDIVSNKKRAIVSKSIEIAKYKKMALAFLLGGLFYAAMAGFETFFFMLVFAGNYFLYSMPPFRLKRIPIISKALISFNSLILILLGFVFITGNLADFPIAIIAIFLIGFTFSINFIDLKDTKGDKKTGIKTLPVLVGIRNAKIITGIFFAATYLSFTAIVKEWWALPTLVILAIIQFILINRKTCNEKPVLGLYILSIIALIIYLVLGT